MNRPGHRGTDRSLGSATCRAPSFQVTPDMPLLIALAFSLFPAAVLAGGIPPGAEERLAPKSISVRFGGSPGRITALPTGSVTVKRSHHCGPLPEATPYWMRFATILFDWRWSAPMPVWAYVIEHPEGVFLIDAGAHPRYRDPEAWSFDPVSRRLVHSFIRLDVRDDETVPARLRLLGIAPEVVRALVLTHQHVDHTGAVPDFPGADVWTSTEEDRSARSIGAMHPLWRSGRTRLRYVDSEGTAGGDGPVRSVFLTNDRRVEVVTTPGHTPGSLSIRVAIDGGDLWMIGDTSFTAGDVGHDDVPTAGIHTDVAAVREHHRRLRAKVPLDRLFPSHDPDVPARLMAIDDGR